MNMTLEWSNCRLCPRQCGANRAAGQTGYCKAGTAVKIFRYGPHGGEEPVISGSRGSGTVFFSRCTMRCLYCQNYPWSQEGAGQRYDEHGLRTILKSLAAAGCHNWNLVSPTPWLPALVGAVNDVKRDGVALPIVYNTSGFERLETLAAIEGWANVYLTDLRYARESSADAGSGAADYVRVARAALREMRRQTGPLKYDAQGLAVSGVICRLLILPGLADEAIENLRWIAGEIGTDVAISVMAQYTPLYKAAALAPWNRGITREEYETVCSEVEDLRFNEGWFQEYGEPPPDGLLGATMAPVAADEEVGSR